MDGGGCRGDPLAHGFFTSFDTYWAGYRAGLERAESTAGLRALLGPKDDPKAINVCNNVII